MTDQAENVYQNGLQDSAMMEGVLDILVLHLDTRDKASEPHTPAICGSPKHEVELCLAAMGC